MTTHYPTTPMVRRLSGTRKREFNLVLYDNPPITKDCNSYWDGGSKDSYAVLDMNGQFVEVPPSGGFNKLAGLYVLQPGTLLMETGIFCGKPSTPTFYGHLADRPWIVKLLGIQ